MLSLPSGHPVWEVSSQNAHPEGGVCPAPSLLPQMVTSANCQPVSSPGNAANPSPCEHHHILGQVFLSPALPLGFGVQIPPFFRDQVRRQQVQPSHIKSPGYISSNVFHFPSHRSPHGPEQFSVTKLFHTFHLFASSLPKTL